jgi:REP element-mobilizing transposase RayT
MRYQQTRQFHFLTFSCYRRLPYLGSAEARDLFEQALERIRRRYVFVVAGYVVMPEHVHLLLSEPRAGSPKSQKRDLGHPLLEAEKVGPRPGPPALVDPPARYHSG